MNKRIIYSSIVSFLLIIVVIALFLMLKKEVSLSHKELIIYTGYSRQISLVNYDGKCQWESLQPEVAAVSDGNIIANKPGETQIICKTEDGEKYICRVQVYERISDVYHNKAEKEVVWLESLQLPDGSFSCYELEEGMPARVNPYFGSYAAIAILRNDHETRKTDKIEAFIDWYFAHMNMRKDVKGSVGTIYDYKVMLENGRIVDETSSKDYDSADSYAAVFLMLLQEYLQKYENQELILENKEKVDILVDLLLSIQKDYYTESKNGSEVKYLMNNMEAYQGFKSALILYKQLWENDDRYAALKKAVKGFEKNFNKSWVGDGYYYPVLDEENNAFYGEKMEWEKLYEYALPQLFPVMFDIVDSDNKLAREVYSRFCEQWDWTEMDYDQESEANQTWSLIAYAAMKMEDWKRVDDYIDFYTKEINDRSFPFYTGDSAWLVLTYEEAYDYYSKKEKEGELIPKYVKK